MGRLIAAWGALAIGCTSTTARLRELRPVGDPWPVYTLCVRQDGSDDARELLALVQAAVEAWGVSWSVTTYERLEDALATPCVPIEIDPDRTGWDDGEVGLTLLRHFGQLPMWVGVSAEFWDGCPEARWPLVLHEIGHAVGHAEHTVARGVMYPTVLCWPVDVAEVSDQHRTTAARRRAGEPL